MRSIRTKGIFLDSQHLEHALAALRRRDDQPVDAACKKNLDLPLLDVAVFL